MKKSLCDLSNEYFETAESNKKIISALNRDLKDAKERCDRDAVREIKSKLLMMYEINRDLRKTAIKLRDYYKYSNLNKSE